MSPYVLARFLGINGPSIRTFDCLMMSDRVDATITRSKKRAQNPRHHTDDDGSKKRIPKSFHMERRNQPGYKTEEQGIDDKNEYPHGEQNKWDAEQQKYRAHKSIDDTKKERGSHKRLERI